MPGPLFLAQLWGGKRPCRQWIINTTSTGGLLLHLKEEHTGLTFLVDTGVSRSILPHRSTAPATGPHLITADGQTIPAWGTHKQTLKISSFHFTSLATVAFPILGNDFLAAHHLLIDPAQPAVIHPPLAVSFHSHRRFLLLPFSFPSLTYLLLFKLFYCFLFRSSKPFPTSWCPTPYPLVFLFLLKPAASIPSVSNKPRLNLLS